MRLMEIQQGGPARFDWMIPAYVEATELDHGEQQSFTRESSRVLARLVNVYKVMRAERGTYTPNTSIVDYASLRKFGEIRTLIENLRIAPPDDELGQIRPSDDAISFALQRLFALCATTTVPVPDDVSTDHDGAIRVEWRRNGKFVEFVIPSSAPAQPFIYHSHGTDFGLTHNISDLRQRLKWFRD